MAQLSFRSIIIIALSFLCHAQVYSYSRASVWNEVLLDAIRSDQARPTVHARNLFHISAAMYDAWAVYDANASTYFLNHTHRGFYIPFDGIEIPSSSNEILRAREIAISYAAYRLIHHRFRHSPGVEEVERRINNLMRSFNLDVNYISTDYRSGNPADLGNYIASQIIAFGLQDGSNEANDYANRQYEPVNPPLAPERYGSGGLENPNRWQPLLFETIQFVGQSGVKSNLKVPEFVGPEWGFVVPFSLTESDRKIYNRDGSAYWVYHDPGPPWYMNFDDPDEEQNYQWAFGLVAHWSSHHHVADSVFWDISPASLGNISIDQFPDEPSAYRKFYNQNNGGDIGQGYAVNPKTNLPYESQIVPRADFTRVVAEFWADGPSSETPPGHWFTILNYVNGHKLQTRKFKGIGESLDFLEWDVKSYFVLGGAMHDVAVTAWGIKGFYDYIRPISAIRKMAEMGQCSDVNLPNYSPSGMILSPGHVELINPGDPLSGANNQNVGKIKIYAWQQHYLDEYGSPQGPTDVGWVLGENWNPYQRASFVTPPFAGYISGHSTFSRAAAVILSLFNGDEYFPGGLGEYVMKKDAFLEFDTGPSVDLKLQWAKYTDASDQSSLSRIWGGIHPPIDDIPGRKIGDLIGRDAFAFAERYFNGDVEDEEDPNIKFRYRIGPNPLNQGDKITMFTDKYDELKKRLQIFDQLGNLIFGQKFYFVDEIEIDTYQLNPGVYYLTISSSEYSEFHRLAVVK